MNVEEPNPPEEVPIAEEEPSPVSEPAAEVKAPGDKPPPPSFLPWPPPGLEKLQGALWPLAMLMGLGAVLVTLPLLISVGTDHGFTSFGPFGMNWWIPALITFTGLIIFFESFEKLFRMLRVANRAVSQGHGWLTIAQVAADRARDTGFLLQGLRTYSGLGTGERGRLLESRLLGIGAYLAAAFWLIAGFVLAIFLAARGIIGPTGIWYVTLLPTGILLLLALYFRIREDAVQWSIRRKSNEAVIDKIAGEIGTWTEQADRLMSEGILSRGPASRVISIRIVGGVVTVIGLMLLVPLMTFTIVGTVIPAFITDNMPRFQSVQDKAMIAEVYREYRSDPDTSISPLRAGEALQNLNCLGRWGELGEFQKAPTVRYDQKWNFGRSRGRKPRYSDLITMDRSDITSEDWAILQEEAANPAHREFEIMGRAVSADFGGAMWEIPFPDTLSWQEFPIPRFQGIVDGARSHLAVAAYQFHRGRVAEAERSIRDVIGTGFLMMDEHPHLIGNLIGIVLISNGGEALTSLYRRTDREVEADHMEEVFHLVQHILGENRVTRRHLEQREPHQAMVSTIGNRETLRGLRWELLASVTTVSPYINLNRAVFGPGEDYEFWLQDIRRSLVRWPAEEARFEMVRYGWFMSPDMVEKRGFVERLLSLTFGKSNTPGSFAAMLRSIR